MEAHIAVLRYKSSAVDRRDRTTAGIELILETKTSIRLQNSSSDASNH